MIDREGGVENQSDMTQTGNGLETDSGQPKRTSEHMNNSLDCDVCQRSFASIRGLRIHQGKVCKKKSKQCRSPDRQTRSITSQESNHSGLLDTTADASSVVEVPIESLVKKQKILWPAANDKASYQKLEDLVFKRMYKKKGSTSEKLKALSQCIYEAGVELFGTVEKTKRAEPKVFVSRRERRMKELRNEKKELRKRWREALPNEKDGIKVLYEDLKLKCRQIQRNIRRTERRKESQQARKSFLKNPYDEYAKKLFTEARSGTLTCNKEELDRHISEVYSDP